MGSRGTCADAGGRVEWKERERGEREVRERSKHWHGFTEETSTSNYMGRTGIISSYISH